MRGWLGGWRGLAPVMVPALLCLHRAAKGCPVRLGHLPWQDSAMQGDGHGEKLGREDGVCGDGTGALQGALPEEHLGSGRRGGCPPDC